MRLERLEEQYGAEIAVTWKSYLLRPHPEPKPMDAFRRYTKSWLNPANQPDGGRFTVWSTDEPPPSHSIPPNVAGKAAARQGVDAFKRLHHALLDAYFYANRNITEIENLVRIAGEVELDAEKFRTDLADPVLVEAVVNDHKEALGSGVQGVPSVIIDDRWKVTGAQDLAVYQHVIDKRLRGELLS